MVIRRCWAWAITGVLILAPFVGCGSDEEPAPGPAAGSAGAAGVADAAPEGAAGAAGQIITGGSGGSPSDASADSSVEGGDSCPITNLDFGQQCMACAKKLCCNALSDCDKDPACVSLAECVVACPVDDAGVIDNACTAACAAAQDVISPAYNGMVFCLGNTDPDAAESCGLPCPF